jgi:hypothetical protein
MVGSHLRHLAAAAVLVACAGCAGGTHYATKWDGRRGYDGNGDYGYDLAESRSEARGYRARAAQAYPVPGTPDDPWGPYIHEASGRFQVPERWIREVMRQESGGNETGPDGAPITSGAGAMGLMQVMPRTYDTLRQRYRLGSDPFNPHDNVLAGTAYIHEMFLIYGSPGFLAAYNAGPDRLDAYLSGGVPLPDETVNYLASIAPRLGTDIAMSGPLAVYAAGLGPSTQVASIPVDPSYRAFDGGGLVTPDAPTGRFTGQGAPPAVARPVEAAAVATPVAVTQLLAPPAAATPVAVSPSRGGAWGIQVGAFPDPARSEQAISAASRRGGDLLAGAQASITPIQRDGVLYRARFQGLSADAAAAACDRLSSQGITCFTVRPGS